MTQLFLPWFLFLLLLGGGTVCASATGIQDRPLVILLIPRTSLENWRSADAPMLHYLMATGSVAVMNTRTARLPSDHRRETPESAALTLGAGSRAAGGSEITDFHPAQTPSAVPGVSYGELWSRRTGMGLHSGGMVNAQWPQIVRENKALGYDLLPGNLGTALETHGIVTTAGGGPMAAVLAADRDGSIGFFVPGALIPHPLPQFLVWDAGADIKKADAIIRGIVSEIRARQGRVIVISPCVSDTQFQRGERLAPVVLWGDGVPPSLLYSASTHRAGLITNTDVAPSMTAFFGDTGDRPWLSVAPFGRPWTTIPSSSAVRQAVQIERCMYRQANGMKILPYVAICLGLLTVMMVFRTWRGLTPGILCWFPSVVVFALLISPTPAAAALWTGFLSCIFWVLRKRINTLNVLLITSILVVLTLVVDMLTGNHLMRYALLGYSAVEGARYYGIGNEAMGPLVGSALIAGALWRQGRLHLMTLTAAFLVLSLLIGLPSWGAKAGGLLVALAAFGTFLWTVWSRRVAARHLLVLIAASILMMALVALFDWHHQSGSQTHIGAAIQRITTGGAHEAWDIVRRKLSVEGRLLYHSAWALPLWISVIGLVCVQKNRGGERGQRLKGLLYGGAVAIVACIAVNDAGAVAAALCGTIVLSGLSASYDAENPRRRAKPSGGGRVATEDY